MCGVKKLLLVMVIPTSWVRIAPRRGNTSIFAKLSELLGGGEGAIEPWFLSTQAYPLQIPLP